MLKNIWIWSLIFFICLDNCIAISVSSYRFFCLLTFSRVLILCDSADWISASKITVSYSFSQNHLCNDWKWKPYQHDQCFVIKSINRKHRCKPISHSSEYCIWTSGDFPVEITSDDEKKTMPNFMLLMKLD